MGRMGASGKSDRKIIDMIYPVGSVYISVSNVSPQSLFGGSWEQLKDRFLLGAGDTYTAGNIGGEATVALTEANNGPHTHTRGTMNITGTLNSRPYRDSGNMPGAIVSASGAFSKTNHGDSSSQNGTAQTGTQSRADRINFNAANSWSGSTSSSGSGTPHNNMPPYLVVYMWKRTA